MILENGPMDNLEMEFDIGAGTACFTTKTQF